MAEQAQLEKDKLERMAARGIKPGDAAAKPAKPEDPYTLLLHHLPFPPFTLPHPPQRPHPWERQWAE